MKELFREPDFTRVAFFRTLLENEGIPTFIENEALAVTAAPIPEFYPALCVVNDDDYGQAVRLIREHLAANPTETGPDKVCPNCGESSPGNFSTCWSCGADFKQGDPR